MGRIPLWQFTSLKIMDHRHCCNEDMMSLVCHVVFPYHVIKESY